MGVGFYGNVDERYAYMIGSKDLKAQDLGSTIDGLWLQVLLPWPRRSV